MLRARTTEVVGCRLLTIACKTEGVDNVKSKSSKRTMFSEEYICIPNYGYAGTSCNSNLKAKRKRDRL